jgi:hypothetical protein
MSTTDPDEMNRAYEDGYEAALERVANGEVEIPKPTPVLVLTRAEQMAALKKRAALLNLDPGTIRAAQVGAASLAIRNTETDAEAVEATRDVLDMLGIGGRA